MDYQNKKSEKQIATEKSNRILEGVATWAAFYRANPQRFAKDYLHIELKTFQKFLLYGMMHNVHFMFWAARGLGKSWLTALFCIIRCILFPHTKICVASSIRSQANEVLQKIEDDFMVLHGWGSDNLRREISECTIGAQKAEIYFRNGSWIKVVTASDTGRGNRANVIVIDEFRMVDRDTINTVIKRFLGDPRQPGYLSKKEYKGKDEYLETNIEIYMSSCWYKSHWSYEKSKAYTVNLLGGREGYFVCALPYQMAIKEGLKKRIEIEDEMSESDFDAVKFGMEMGCMPFGDNEDAFFSFDDVSNRRTLKTALYPPIGKFKDIKIPDRAFNERRILSLDVALMASKSHKNDASSLFINSAIPNSSNEYTTNLVYLENFEGINADDLALYTRRYFHWYKCTDLVIDGNGIGLAVYDALTKDIVDYEMGIVYPALSCCNNEEMADRCSVPNAEKVIWVIKANASFNNEISILLRNGFQQNKINLLVSEFESEEILKDKVKGFSKMSSYEQMLYKMPYIQTTLLIYELINLQYEIKGTNVKIVEKSGMRKDRYSSLAYNYWVQCQIERKLLNQANKNFVAAEYAKKIKNLNKKPRMY